MIRHILIILRADVTDSKFNVTIISVATHGTVFTKSAKESHGDIDK